MESNYEDLKKRAYARVSAHMDKTAKAKEINLLQRILNSVLVLSKIMSIYSESPSNTNVNDLLTNARELSKFIKPNIVPGSSISATSAAAILQMIEPHLTPDELEKKLTKLRPIFEGNDFEIHDVPSINHALPLVVSIYSFNTVLDTSGLISSLLTSAQNVIVDCINNYNELPITATDKKAFYECLCRDAFIILERITRRHIEHQNLELTKLPPDQRMSEIKKNPRLINMDTVIDEFQQILKVTIHTVSVGAINNYER